MRSLARYILFFIGMPTLAFAQGVQPEFEGEEWVFGGGIYLWATNIEGVTTIGPREVGTDASFSELIDSLEGAFSAHFEALSPARLGIGVDYLYVRVGEEDIETEFRNPKCSSMRDLLGTVPSAPRDFSKSIVPAPCPL